MQDETLLMALEFTGMEPIPVAQRMSGRLLKGRSDRVLITRAMSSSTRIVRHRGLVHRFRVTAISTPVQGAQGRRQEGLSRAGDLSLANELRESPHLRDDVFLLEDLIPEARWTRGGLRADDTQFGKEAASRRARRCAYARSAGRQRPRWRRARDTSNAAGRAGRRSHRGARIR